MQSDIRVEYVVNRGKLEYKHKNPFRANETSYFVYLAGIAAAKVLKEVFERNGIRNFC